MKGTLWFRIKFWACSKIGHRRGETWHYQGWHATCKRCGVIYSLDVKDIK